MNDNKPFSSLWFIMFWKAAMECLAMKMAAKIEAMFVNGGAIRRRDIEKECECYPNRIYRVNGWFVLVAMQSLNGSEYPIGERGLVRARKSLDLRRVDNAYIVLANRDEKNNPVYQSHQTLGNVERILEGITVRKFREEYGPCWFVDKTFAVSANVLNQRDAYEM